MKRRREVMEEQQTEIRSAIEELSLLVKLTHKKPPSAEFQQEGVVLSIPTRPFLSVCSLIIQVLDKIGPTMTVLRQDIYKNIQMMEMFCESHPATYLNLVEIAKKEAAIEGNPKKGDSCSNALLWLTRALDFTAALLQRLESNPRESMQQIVTDSYETTLKPWHGWISAAAYKVALKLVPETNTFLNLLMAKGENLDTLQYEIRALLTLLVPVLEDLHCFLKSYGLEKMRSTQHYETMTTIYTGKRTLH